MVPRFARVLLWSSIALLLRPVPAKLSAQEGVIEGAHQTGRESGHRNSMHAARASALSEQGLGSLLPASNHRIVPGEWPQRRATCSMVRPRSARNFWIRSPSIIVASLWPIRAS
jgi:hypothetical protein